MEILMCKKDFSFFKKGEIYNYWTNFGGLNHIVSNGPETYPFDGEKSNKSSRPYLYDYFWTKEEMRNIKINKIINVS